MTSEVPDLPGLTDLSLLGRGGLADVYLARQQHLERWVAAKVFRVTLADDQAAERFRAECRAIGRLDQYPHVLTVYDAGVLGDGRPYLISERCDGSLHDLVGMRGALPPDRVAALGSTIGRALRFAHSAGVLHGDVTPHNLLLRTSGAPVLADFGLAVLRDHAPTAAGFTLLHAAPEALRSGAAIDERADVYGLGSTLYTVLTGTPPFPQRPDEDGATYRARRHDEPAPRPDGVTDQLAGLLTAMLATDPAHRPSTDEVITALETTSGRGTRPALTGGTLVATSPQPDPAPSEPDAAPARPTRTARTPRTPRTPRTKAWRARRGAATPRPWDTRVTRSTAATSTGTGRSVEAAGPDDAVTPGPLARDGSEASAAPADAATTAEPDGQAAGPTAAYVPLAPIRSDLPDGLLHPCPSPDDADRPATGPETEPTDREQAAAPATTYIPLAPIRSDLPDGLLYPSPPPEDADPPATGPEPQPADSEQAVAPATTYVPPASLRSEVTDGLGSEHRAGSPTSTLLPAPGASSVDPDDGHDVAAPVRIPGRRRRRRRSGGKALLAAGGATAVLVAGAGATAVWRAADDGAPEAGAERSPSVPPTGAARPPATPRAVPVDLPPAAVLPGSTLGAVPTSPSAGPAPPVTAASAQRPALRTPSRPVDDARPPATAGRAAPAPGPAAPRTADPAPRSRGAGDPTAGNGAGAQPQARDRAARPPAAPAARPPAAPAPAAGDPGPPPTAQGRPDPTQAPRPEIHYR